MRSNLRATLSAAAASPFSTTHHLRPLVLRLHSRDPHQLRCLSSLSTVSSSSSLPPIDVSIRSFPLLRQAGSVYVDKTQHLAALLEPPREKFLSRPRRFGKSTLISTIEAAFMPNGPNKDQLFEGLWVQRNAPHLLEHELPVLSFDLSALAIDQGPDVLRHSLRRQLHTIAQSLEVPLPDDPVIAPLVSDLIANAAAKTPRNQVVVLIDEYDAPIVRLLEADGKHESAMANRSVLSEFFSTIKSKGPHIHFQFVTGVSKFVRTALFSGANQLVDISLRPRFSSVVGYTRPEIEAAFGPHLAALAAKEGFADREELWKKIAAWYDGYSWGGAEPIFNPWSIGNLLAEQRFHSFWPALGTPEWLLKLLVNDGLQDLTEQLAKYHDEAAFDRIEIDAIGRSSWDNISLLFQTGFLAIADVKEGPSGSQLRLDFPNQEVKEAMARELFKTAFSGTGDFSKIQYLRQALDDNDVERFYGLLDAGLRNVPFTTFKKRAAITDAEAHHNAMVSVLLPFVLPKGYVVRSEDTTSDGQIDLVIETPARVFLCEHKILPKGAAEATSEAKQARMKKLAQEALDQIKHKNYGAKYRADSRPITIVGVCFDGETRGVGHVLVEATKDRCERERRWPLPAVHQPLGDAAVVIRT